MYAYAVDGLDWDARDHFDERLNALAGTTTEPEAASASPREQARAQATLMAAMQKAGRG